MARAPLLLLLAVSSLVLSAYCTSLPAVDTNATGIAREPDKVGDPANDAYNGVVDGDEMTGFPLDDLDDDALEELMEVEDNILVDQTGVHISKKLFLESEDLRTKSKGAVRRKRAIGLALRGAFALGRSLFSKFSKGSVTRSGDRITRQYDTPGTSRDAVRDFNKLRPDNVKPIDNGRGISGQTGTMGNHRVTVRDGSKGNSRPTLEIRSHGGKMVRKFRYEKPKPK